MIAGDCGRTLMEAASTDRNKHLKHLLLIIIIIYLFSAAKIHKWMQKSCKLLLNKYTEHLNIKYKPV